MKVLCIGNGSSIRNNRHIIEDDCYDLKIGTKFQFELWPELKVVAVGDRKPAEILSEKFRGLIITKWEDHTTFYRPHHVDMDDITGTIQMKYAIEKGATEITTVGFDCLKNRLNKHINWTWTKPLPWEMNEEQKLKWDYALAQDWKNKIKKVEHDNIKIKWRHIN